MKTFASPSELPAAIGTVFGPGEGILVDQQRIAAFADVTDDHQWIHLDVERAAAGPFGGTVAHGYLTLSLLSALTRELYRVQGTTMTVNYGLNRVRFPAPLLAGSVLRATAELTSVDQVAGGYQVVLTVTMIADGAEKPCCVAESVSRHYSSEVLS